MNHHRLIASTARRRRASSTWLAATGLSLLGSMALLPGAALAQDGDAPAETDAPGTTELVITGTRISGFAAPTPLTTIGETELADRGVRNLADLLTDVPALKANQNTGQSSQPIGASNLDLRGLGPNRTLLLVDGRRFAATDPTGGVDINVIPVGLIRRLDIITGGASAAYGSDAVSGVVNIVLDNRFEGLRGDVQYGESTYGDIESPGASLTTGRAFLDGRLHVVASADYFRNDGQLAQDSRPWARGDYAILTNPAFPGTPGAPRQIIAPNARFSQMTFGGVTARNSIPALRNLQFGPGGTVLPFVNGTNVGNVYMTGGDGASLSSTSNILPELERYSAYGRVTFDATDAISLYADALYSNADIFSDGTTATDNGTILIQRDNAFLPQQIGDILDANAATSFRIGRVAGEDGAFTNIVRNTVQRYGFGVDARFSDAWRASAFVQLSRTRYDRDDGNNRIEARWLLGLDSVIDPVSGQPVCRALLTNPAPTDAQDPRRDIRDCVPINPFGAGSISLAALDYYKGVATLRSNQRQDVYALNVDGRLFDTWAGPVSVAFGAEYREESIRASTDEISQLRGWKTVNPQPLSGSVNVKEAYTEMVVPLLDEGRHGQSLDVNGAVRFTDYSSSGSVTTWKVGVNYSPFADLRLRGTLSRDIRAASINELFSGQNQFFNNITNPITNVTINTLQLTGGNPDLTPERADSLTLGLIYQPSWLRGLRMSIDYYSIDISNAIASLTGQQIVDGCLTGGQTDLCPAITFNGDVITQVQATLINAAGAKSSGIDVELAYTMPLGAGRLDFRGLVNWVETLSTTVNAVTIDYVGQVGTTSAVGPAGGIPRWRATLSAAYRDSRFGLGAQLRYVDGGIRNVAFVEGVDIDDNHVSARAYVDVNASYRITPNVQLFTSIDNLFNKAPPLTPNAITAPSYASSSFYDRIGRFMTFGARFNF